MVLCGGSKCEVTIHGTDNQKPITDAGPDQKVSEESHLLRCMEKPARTQKVES